MDDRDKTRLGFMVEAVIDSGVQRADLHETEAPIAPDLECEPFPGAATPSDPVGAWLPPRVAASLAAAGLDTLQDLRRHIQRGGRWWSIIPTYGPTKAGRLAERVQRLLGAPPAITLAPSWSLSLAQAGSAGGRPGSNRVQDLGNAAGMVDDHAAIEAWIDARAGSEPTRRQYRREAERWLLWCVVERCRSMSDASADDCCAYAEFLQNIPDCWVSRRKLPRLAPGWAPFRGPLSRASQQVAIDTLHAMCEWLVAARYLVRNPWGQARCHLGARSDPPRAADEQAFIPEVWQALLDHLEAQPPGPAVERMRWLLTFGEATGLLAAELLRARVGHLQRTVAGWLISVQGKGGRHRTVPVPRVAMQATDRYLASRGLDLDSAPAGTPLLASLTAPGEAPSYPAVYQSFKAFVHAALEHCDLHPSQRSATRGAALRWLRHSHATRAAERGVPLDVLQVGLGHADPRRTATYYRTQTERRQSVMERAFAAVGATE